MYIFIADPGHGWLRVLKTEIAQIKYKISPYSYMNGKFVYLEEDCDAPLFLEHKFGKNINYQELKDKKIIKHQYVENTSIRGYSSYYPE